MRCRIIPIGLIFVIGIVIFHNVIPHHHHGIVPVRFLSQEDDHCDHKPGQGNNTETCNLSSISFTSSRTAYRNSLPELGAETDIFLPASLVSGFGIIPSHPFIRIFPFKAGSLSGSRSDGLNSRAPPAC